jgi:hypothetical protein
MLKVGFPSLPVDDGLVAWNCAAFLFRAVIKLRSIRPVLMRIRWPVITLACLALP